MTLPPAPPAMPAIAAYELLDLPVALADAQGRVQAVNGAFMAFTHIAEAAAVGQRFDELLCGPATDPVMRLWLGQRLKSAQGFAPVDFTGRDARGQPLHCRLGMRSAERQGSTGLVLSLQPTGRQHQLQQDNQHLAGLMEMAQDYGRLGVWERDLRTREGRWDRHVWQLWGLTPRDGALPFEQAVQSVLAEDREALRAAYAESAQRCGMHSMRFRVRAADGSLRHLRSQWQTHPGADGRPERAQGILMDDTEAFRLAQSHGETHAQLRLAMELADIMVWRYDHAQRRLFTSDSGWALLHRAPQPEGIAVESLGPFVHASDLPEVLARIRRAETQDGPVEVGTRYQRGDGQMRYLLTRCIAQRNEQGEFTGYLGVALDLTERFVQSQREMELARRLEMATSAAGVAIWTQDIDTGEMHWDDQMRLLHGGRDAAVATSMDDYRARYLHPDDHASALEAIRTLLSRKSGMVDLDLRIRRSDGTMRRVASRTSIESGSHGITLYGVMLDVTERHAAERRLRDASERVALATRGAGIGTWETDLDGEIGVWDEQMFRLRGREPRAAPVGRAERNTWIHPDDLAATRGELVNAIAEGRPSDAVFRVIWPDGSVHWLASRSVPVDDEHGRGVRRIGINWDVTDAHAAAQALQDKQLAQRESQAKSQFLARMSHELRTPLNAVLGFAQLLLTDGPAQDETLRRRRVEHIHAAGEHLLSLINDVLDLSSLESGELPLQLAPVALPALLQSVLPLVENLAHQHGVQLRLGELDFAVRADPMRLRQVLINLLSNAIKYNRPDGHVQVEARREDGTIVLQVRDSGRGMSAQQLQHVFEPFNRLGAEREGMAGTDIGLAIAQASMQHMGGSVTAGSDVGVGSCFTLHLPAAEPGHDTVGVLEPVLPAPPALHHLLYIEDNPVNVMIVSELIGRRHDLQLESAPDGRSGIELARASAPELILVDMQLPDFDGHEVLRRLRADPATAGIRCIALSANAMPEDIRHALAAGFDDYWTKPLDFRRFMGALDQLFGAEP
ncbi:PAS domain-containing protein [Aquabacterium sp.]|uniref:PAS domain-containing protein n=1 Tax=Aquabacterium sp. TaxID=1872578 RepID=UPI002CEE3AB8|nr:PAS domain-containing protein [Aquabacterium sp.]HSW08243.1 PAS domain-containing protein [Aquabacterium sp.]